MRHGSISMYDLKDLPTFVFLVTGAKPQVFCQWDTMISDEIQRRQRMREPERNRGENAQGFYRRMPSSLSDVADDHETVGSDSFDLQSESLSFSDALPDGDSQGGSGSVDSAGRGEAGPMSIRWPASMQAQTPMNLQMSHAAIEASQRAAGGSSKSTLLELLQRQGQQPNAPCVFTQHVQSLDNHELAEFAINAGKLACRLSNETKVIKKNLKNSQQTVRRLKDRLAKSKAAVVDAKHATTQEGSLYVEKRGSRLTFKGSVALGVRKAMGLVSAASFPLTTLIDSSRWTVTRAEVHSWALVVARARAFYTTLFSLLSYVNMKQQHYKETEPSEAPNIGTVAKVEDTSTGSLPDLQINNRFISQDEAVSLDCKLPVAASIQQRDLFTAFTVGSTLFSGDATNANIWQRQKLQGLETCTLALVSAEAFDKGDLKSAFARLHQTYLNSTQTHQHRADGSDVTYFGFFVLCKPVLITVHCTIIGGSNVF